MSEAAAATPAASAAPASSAAAPASSSGDAAAAVAAAASAAASATPGSNGQPAQGAAGSPGDKGEQKPGAPEKYEFKAPDGVTLNPEVIAEFSTIAKELGLPQDAAQKVIDKLAPKLAAVNTAQAKDAITRMKTEWSNAAKADKELVGQDGKQFDASLAVAKKGLGAFGTPALNKLLADTGLGNHPEVIRMFAKVGKLVREDQPVAGSAAPAGGTDNRPAAEKLFGANPLK